MFGKVAPRSHTRIAGIFAALAYAVPMALNKLGYGDWNEAALAMLGGLAIAFGVSGVRGLADKLKGY